MTRTAVISTGRLELCAARLFFTEKFDHAGTGQRPGVLVERASAQVIGFVLAFGLSTLGCTRLLAQVSPQNPASMGALEKIGMHLHSTVESEGPGQRHVYVATAAA